MEYSAFETVDLYLAAYLHANSYPGTLVINRGRVVFTFSQSPELFSCVNRYNTNTSIGVLDFTASVKIMRGLMIEAKKNGSGKF